MSVAIDSSFHQRYIVPALIAGGTALASALYGAWSSRQQTKATNDAQKEIASQNLAFQRENLAYQKAVQQKQWEREDTAYQRTVNDMRAAGMSPLAMNGTDGAGEVVATQALHNDYRPDYHDQSPQFIANAIQQAGSVISTISQLRMQQEELRGMKIDNNIKLNNAATEHDFKVESLNALKSSNAESTATFETRKSMLEEQLKALQDSNKFNKATDKERRQLITAQVLASGLSNDISAEQLKKIQDEVLYSRTYGITDNMDDLQKLIRLLAPALGVDLGDQEHGFKKLSPEMLKKVMNELMNGTKENAQNLLRSALGFDDDDSESLWSRFKKAMKTPIFTPSNGHIHKPGKVSTGRGHF